MWAKENAECRERCDVMGLGIWGGDLGLNITILLWEENVTVRVKGRGAHWVGGRGSNKKRVGWVYMGYA